MKTTKTQLSTSVPPETKQAYDDLVMATGLSLTTLLTAGVPLLQHYYQQAELVAGYVQLDRPGDLGPDATCPECDQPYSGLPWIAVRANGATCAPICRRCATSE